MKIAGFAGLLEKRCYPKGNYSPEIRNLIRENFQSTKPHEKWLIDITEKRYLTGTIYLAFNKDAVRRVAVKYATGKNPNSKLVVRALTIATEGYKPKGAIVHFDMESVFKSEQGPAHNAVSQAGFTQSIGNAGLSFANQMIESFFGKSKQSCFTVDYGNLMRRSMRHSSNIMKTSITQSDLRWCFIEEPR